MERLEKEQTELQMDNEAVVPSLQSQTMGGEEVNEGKGDNNDVGDVKVPKGDTCCYPCCMFSMIPGGGLQLDECQGSDGKTKKLHHTCNMAWLESKGVTDAELRNLSWRVICFSTSATS